MGFLIFFFSLVFRNFTTDESFVYLVLHLMVSFSLKTNILKNNFSKIFFYYWFINFTSLFFLFFPFRILPHGCWTSGSSIHVYYCFLKISISFFLLYCPVRIFWSDVITHSFFVFCCFMTLFHISIECFIFFLPFIYVVSRAYYWFCFT